VIPARRRGDHLAGWPAAELGPESVLPGGRQLEVYSLAAGFYVALLKNGYSEEADEFQQWFLDSFDIDLES
jgi:hypothetical protein